MENRKSGLSRSSKSSIQIRRGKLSGSRFQSNLNPHQLKFKQIKDVKQNINAQKFNQLDSKYNIFTNGTPNKYSSDADTMKVNNIRNQVHTLDFPFIDTILNKLKEAGKQGGSMSNLNNRDYDLYPSLMKKGHQTHKYRDLLSDKQEIKDFLKWFQSNIKQIQENQQLSQVRKFQKKQVLIASGFNQLTTQVSKLSKPRSQILKMLWNRQANEVQKVVESLSQICIKNQKQYLQSLSQMHTQYQTQIETLKNQNLTLSKSLNQERLINKGFVNNLRYNRRCCRKYEILIKKINQKYDKLCIQNLNLLEENTKLIIANNAISIQEDFLTLSEENSIQSKKRQSTTAQSKNNIGYVSSQLKNSHAKILLYRRLHIKQSIQKLKKSQNKNQFRDEVSKDTARQLQTAYGNQLLEDKKAKLFAYLSERMKQFPFQKLFIAEDFFHDQENTFSIEGVQNILKAVLQSKQTSFALNNERNIFQKADIYEREIAQLGVNTVKQVQNQFLNEQKQIKNIQEKDYEQNRIKDSENTIQNLQVSDFGVQTQTYNQNESLRKTTSLLQADYQENSKHKIRQSKTKLRNSLYDIQLQRKSFFKNTDQSNQIQRQQNLHQEEYSQTKSTAIKASKDSKFFQNKRVKPEQNIKLNIVGISHQVQNNHSYYDQKSEYSQEQQQCQSDSSSDDLVEGQNKFEIDQKKPQQRLVVKKIKTDKKLKKKNHSVQNKLKLKKIETSKRVSSVINQPEKVVAEFKAQEKQIQDLICVYFKSKTNRDSQNLSVPRNPQKFLNSILSKLWKSILNQNESSQNLNFSVNLYKVIQASFGNNKQTNSKLISILEVIKHYQFHNQLLTLTCLFLGIGDKLSQYQKVIGKDVTAMYFQLFDKLSLKNPKQKRFNVWKPYTSIFKIKSQQVEQVLGKYFSKVKVMFIQMKIQQFIQLMQNQRTRNMTKLNKSSKNLSTRNLIEPQHLNVFNEQSAIIPLNSLILYIIQVYLAQKQQYHTSYSNMIKFFNKSYKTMSRSLLNTLLQDFFVIDIQQSKRVLKQYVTNYQQSSLDKGFMVFQSFYQLCVEYDLPLFEEVTIEIVNRYKNLKVSIKQKYCLQKLNKESIQTTIEELKIKILQTRPAELIEGYNNLLKIIENYSFDENLKKQLQFIQTRDAMFFMIISEIHEGQEEAQ